MPLLRSTIGMPGFWNSGRASACESSTVLGPPRTRDARSGAIAMNPWAANWSATLRTQVESPKISWTTTTTGALFVALRFVGLTIHAISESFLPSPQGSLTHSPLRGLDARRCAAALLLGGSWPSCCTMAIAHGGAAADDGLPTLALRLHATSETAAMEATAIRGDFICRFPVERKCS